jgi:hypothetical protein
MKKIEFGNELLKMIMATTKPTDWAMNEIAMHHGHDNKANPKKVWNVEVKMPAGFTTLLEKMAAKIADETAEDREQTLAMLLGEVMSIFITEGMKGMLLHKHMGIDLEGKSVEVIPANSPAEAIAILAEMMAAEGETLQ